MMGLASEKGHAPDEGREEVSDGSLLQRFAEGKHDAATDLYVRYADRLLALARRNASPALAGRLDPDDVVQSVFRTFFRRAAEGYYSGPAGAELWQLLLTICLNKIRALGTYHRAKKRDVSATQSIDRWERLAEAGGDNQQVALQTLEWVIGDVFAELTESQQLMIQMRIDGYDIEEIARRSERSKRTVERVLERFRQRLTELLDVQA